jgi:hypothetical protein
MAAQQAVPRLRPLVTQLPDRTFHRYTYGDMFEWARRLAVALAGLAVKAGDRVAAFCWNTYHQPRNVLCHPRHGGLCTHRQSPPPPGRPGRHLHPCRRSGRVPRPYGAGQIVEDGVAASVYRPSPGTSRARVETSTYSDKPPWLCAAVLPFPFRPTGTRWTSWRPRRPTGNSGWQSSSPRRWGDCACWRW